MSNLQNVTHLSIDAFADLSSLPQMSYLALKLSEQHTAKWLHQFLPSRDPKERILVQLKPPDLEGLLIDWQIGPEQVMQSQVMQSLDKTHMTLIQGRLSANFPGRQIRVVSSSVGNIRSDQIASYFPS
jgi:hypothetical protein